MLESRGSLTACVRASHRHCTFALWSQQLLLELSWVLLMVERVILRILGPKVELEVKQSQEPAVSVLRFFYYYYFYRF